MVRCGSRIWYLPHFLKVYEILYIIDRILKWCYSGSAHMSFSKSLNYMNHTDICLDYRRIAWEGYPWLKNLSLEQLQTSENLSFSTPQKSVLKEIKNSKKETPSWNDHVEQFHTWFQHPHYTIWNGISYDSKFFTMEIIKP